MAKTLSSSGLDEKTLDRITAIIQDDLGVIEMDFDQKEALRRVVMLSVNMYLLILKETENPSTRLIQ